MSEKSELSQKAKEICNANFAKHCGDCQLRPACRSSMGAGREDLNKWTDEVNRLAEGCRNE